jgi:hypothetical protein
MLVHIENAFDARNAWKIFNKMFDTQLESKWVDLHTNLLWGSFPSTIKVISKHGQCKREDPLDITLHCKGTKISMVKESKERTLYLSCPSKWSKVHLFGLVVALSSSKLEKYSI